MTLPLKQPFTASRVDRLSRERPARLIVFDLLVNAECTMDQVYM